MLFTVSTLVLFLWVGAKGEEAREKVTNFILNICPHSFKNDIQYFSWKCWTTLLFISEILVFLSPMKKSWFFQGL